MTVEGSQEYAGEQSETALFGSQLRSLRRKHDLSQRTLAASIGIPQSNLSMIERGKRHPPRLVSFYEHLRQVPGVEESEVVALRRAQDAPVWLINDQNLEAAQRTAVVSEPDVDIELRIHVDPAEFYPDELDALQQVVITDVRLALSSFLRRSVDKNSTEILP